MQDRPLVEPVVVSSILERTAEATVAALDEVPTGSGLVEIRGDHLRAAEIGEIVRRTGPATLVTLRRPLDLGFFEGSEEERRRGLTAALDAGADFVDVEWQSPLAALAHGPHAPRTILSHHGAACRPAELLALYRAMRDAPAARLKIVPLAEVPGEIAAVRELLALAVCDGRPLAAFAMGRAGSLSRLLAPSWGSWASFGSCPPGRVTAPGQYSAAEMIDVHDVLGISESTRRFALIGRAVSDSPSPAMHRAGFLAAGLDARYFAIDLDDFEACLPLVGPQGVLGLAGLGVTRPFKEDAAARCVLADPVAQLSRAVNTVRIRDGIWTGYNTDGPAMLERVGRHIEPKSARVAVVGAGGTARAAAAAFRAAGASVALFNRTHSRGARAAEALGVDARPLAGLADADWDVLIQATPLGARGEEWLPASSLRGRVVLDAVYGVETALIREARGRGLATIDGLELLVAQAVRQFALLNDGVRPDPTTFDRAARSALARSSP